MVSTMLYPYLRATIADAITRTTMPALHLAEVNFQSLYEQRLAQAADDNQKQDVGIAVPPGATKQ